MKKKVLISIIIVIVVLGGLFFINAKKKNNKIATVKTSIVQLGELKSYISTTAMIKSQNRKEYFGLQSKVKKINVAIGDNVKIGDVLITYESLDLGSTVSQAQIQYDNAILSKNDIVNQNNIIKKKISDLENEIAILEKSIIPSDKAKLESLKQQKNALSPISNEKLKQADNAVKLTEISLTSAKQKVSESKNTIVAENNGVVTDLNALEGSISNGMVAVIVVQDLVNLKATASLGKYDATKVKIGQEVTIKNGNSTYKGTISFIEPAAKKTIGVTGSVATLGIEISITDSESALKIDFDVDVDIEVDKVADAIKIPSEALKVEKGGKNFIYVVEENIVHERAISIGSQSDTEVQVTNGASVGDKVILNPSSSIKEGTKIKEAAENK